MLRCTINELFDWRFMQTDPNWGNFLFDRETGAVAIPSSWESRYPPRQGWSMSARWFLLILLLAWSI